MATTLATIRDRAPRPIYGQLLDAAITAVPLLTYLRWESTTSDEQAYRRRRGVATAPHFNPDSTMADGNDEEFDPLVAKIRPFGGAVSEPNIGLGFGDPMEAISAKVIAAGKQFVTSALGGVYADGVTYTPVLGAASEGIDVSTPGPLWDTRGRRSGAVLKCRVDGTDRYLSLMADGDTGFGTETTAIATGTPDATYRVASANPNYWVDLYIDCSDLVAQVAADKVWAMAFTSSTNAFDSAIRLCVSGQYSAITPAAIDIGHLDIALDLLKTPGPTALMLAPRDFRNLLSEARDLGGATFTEVSGFSSVVRYRDALVFSQEGMSTTRTVGASSGVCSCIVGFDLATGLVGLYKSDVPNPMAMDDSVLRALPGAQRSWGGLYVRTVGEDRTYDNQVTKATWYASVMNLDAQGICVVDGLLAA